MIIVRLPYLGALSSQIEKEIGPFLKRQTSGRVKLRVKVSGTFYDIELQTINFEVQVQSLFSPKTQVKR